MHGSYLFSCQHFEEVLGFLELVKDKFVSNGDIEIILRPLQYGFSMEVRSRTYFEAMVNEDREDAPF